MSEDKNLDNTEEENNTISPLLHQELEHENMALKQTLSENMNQNLQLRKTILLMNSRFKEQLNKNTQS